MYRFYVAALLFCLGVATSHADNGELLFSDDFGEFVYNKDASEMGLDNQGLALGILVDEDNNIIPHGKLLQEVLKDKTPLTLQVGAGLYFAGLTEPDDDIVGLAFGARARYKLPFDNVPVLQEFPLYISSSIFFAPEITTSGSNIDIIDFDIIRGELEFTPTIRGFIGIRVLEIDRGAGDDEIVDNLYVGARLLF